MPVTTAIIVQVLLQQRDKLFAYIWTIVRDTQLVEDTLQELSILALQKGIEVEDEQRLVVWLRRAARLKSLEMLRLRSRVPVTLNDVTLDRLESFWAEQDALPLTSTIDSLRVCISKLSEGNRRILALRHFEGKKTADVARIVGRKVEVVYTMLARIHRALRECVQARRKEENAHG